MGKSHIKKISKFEYTVHVIYIGVEVLRITPFLITSSKWQ